MHLAIRKVILPPQEDYFLTAKKKQSLILLAGPSLAVNRSCMHVEPIKINHGIDLWWPTCAQSVPAADANALWERAKFIILPRSIVRRRLLSFTLPPPLLTTRGLAPLHRSLPFKITPFLQSFVRPSLLLFFYLFSFLSQRFIYRSKPTSITVVKPVDSARNSWAIIFWNDISRYVSRANGFN